MLDKLWVKIVFCFLIFAISIIAYYYPVHVKGYPANVGFTTLSQARNFAESGTYNYESADGVLLASENVVDEAKPAALLNPLTIIIYGQIFKHVDTESISLKNLLYLAILLAAAANVILFILIARLFSPLIGLISAIIAILLPLRVSGVISLIYDEWGLLFFILALFLYLGSKAGPFNSGKVRLLLSSVLFALSALARNAFLFSVIPIVIYDFYVNRSFRRILLLAVPFGLIFVSTLTPFSWLGVPNGYISSIDSQPFGQIGHVFDDPYSAYYDRENVLGKIESQSTLGRLETHYLKDWGYEVGLQDQLRAYVASAKFYLIESTRLISLGGPLIIFLMIVGSYFLYRNQRKIFWFFAIWIFFWLAGLVYFETSNRSHYLEILVILSSLAGLGLYKLLEQIQLTERKKLVVSTLIVLLLMAHLTYATRWKLSEAYKSSNIAIALKLGDTVKEKKASGRIAVGIHTSIAGAVHYISNKDTVYFSPDTIERLLNEGRLREAFEIYEIKSIAGYDEALSEKMQEKIRVEVVDIEFKS